jgi:hypothetical protein
METPEEAPEITEQSLLGNTNQANQNNQANQSNQSNQANEAENQPIEANEANEANKTNNKNKNKNKKPVLYNAESEEIVYKNIQNLSPNNLFAVTSRLFTNPNTRHRKRKYKSRKTRKTRGRK